jgi:DNA-binding MarR family transcriptional regulator
MPRHPVELKAKPHALVRPKSARADRAELEMGTLQGFRTVFGAARSQDAEVRRIAKLSASQLWALAEIAGQNGMTVNGLAERMALHQTTASNLVNALVARKMIRRARDAKDQRVVHLHATAEGRRTLARVPPPHFVILVDALKRMPANELRILAGALRGLVRRMQSAAPTAGGETLMGD